MFRSWFRIVVLSLIDAGALLDTQNMHPGDDTSGHWLLNLSSSNRYLGCVNVAFRGNFSLHHSAFHLVILNLFFAVIHGDVI